MRKYGKYEKMPDGTRAKQPAVKGVLLQTYFTSLICLVLCVSMFFGTSYAWFTSEVKNTGNEIYIGTLDVDLQDKNGDSLAGSDKKLFDSNIRWEPGYTALETVTVINKGDLAFRYELTFTDGSVDGKIDKTLEEVAQWFDVWCYHDVAPTLDSYEQIKEDNGWIKIGSLMDVLDVENGKAIFYGKMTQQDVADKKATAHTYTIALHMNGETTDAAQQNALNALMGQKISLNVKLVATQLSSEEDGFGNGKYDSIFSASNAEDLKIALDTGSDVLLTSDAKIKALADTVTMSGGVLDGNGKRIAYSGGRNASGGSVGVVTTSGGTIRNLTIDGGDNGRALYITKLTSDLFVSGCTLSGVYSFNLNSADATEYTLNFTDTTFTDWTSYANAMKHAYFTGCTFNAMLKPYGDTTLTDCEFTTESLGVSALEAGKTVTLINCTYGGKFIEKAVLTASGEGITINESSVIAVNDQGMVILNSNG